MASQPAWTDDWAENASEEAALLAGLPESPRVRRLLGELEILMMRAGFLHLGTDDMAREVRCSKATLYRLAPSREELFELVVGLWLARGRDAGWRAVEAGADWPARLIGFLTAGIDFSRGVSPEFTRDVRGFPGGYRCMSDHQDRREAGLRFIIEAGITAREFRDIDARLAAGILAAAVRRISQPDFLAAGDIAISEAFGQTYRIFEFGLIPQPCEEPAGS